MPDRDAVSDGHEQHHRRLAEGTLTEIPEHLLERSRSRRAALGLGGDAPAASIPDGSDAGGGAPATTAAAAAPAAAGPTGEFSTPAKPKAAVKAPAPHIVAATTRGRIPVWAMPVLAFLPVWAVIYVGTLSDASQGGMTALAAGAEEFTASGCAGCHGASGGGGVGPAFTGGAILDTFPDPTDHIRWVQLGSDGWKAEVGPTRGANDKPVNGGMAGFGPGKLDTKHLLFVVRHERENLGGEEFDPEVWAPILEELAADPLNEIDDAFIEEFLADGIVVEGGGGGGH